MTALKIFVTFAIGFVFCPWPRSAAQVKEAIPAHDIDAYEKAGPYEHERLPGGSPSSDQFAKEREWLWSHWTEKRLGLLMYVSYSIEGDRAAFFYFVEPDKGGRWRMGVKIERVDGDRANLGCDHFSIYTYSSYAVSRVEKRADSQGYHAPVPIEEKRNPNEYFLLLADKDGKKLTQF
jgi:hypothetical protein